MGRNHDKPTSETLQLAANLIALERTQDHDGTDALYRRHGWRNCERARHLAEDHGVTTPPADVPLIPPERSKWAGLEAKLLASAAHEQNEARRADLWTGINLTRAECPTRHHLTRPAPQRPDTKES